MSKLWNREPAAILAVIGAIIALIAGFGFDLTDKQMGLIMAAASAILGLLTRSQVTPTADPKLPPPTP